MPTLEHRLSLALKGAKSGLWDWNIPEGKVYFGPNYFLISGYEPDDFPHHYDEWKKRVHPEDIVSAEKAIQQYMSGEIEIYAVEFRFKTKRSDWMWILAQGEITEWAADDNPVRFTGLHIDISQRKSVEEALQKSEKYSHLLIEQAPEAITVYDIDLDCFVDCNIKATELFGYSREEFLAGGQKRFYPSDQPDGLPISESIADNNRRALAGETVQFERTVQKANGQKVSCEVHLVQLPTENRRLMRATFIDITKSKQAEEELQKSVDRFEKLSSLTFEGIVLHDKGVAIDVNQSFTKLFGYTKEEIIGKSIIELLFSSEQHPIIYENIAKSVASPYELIARKKDGTLIPIEVESRNVEVKREYFRVTAFRDITVRKQAEEERERLLQAIDQSSETIVITDAQGIIQYTNPAFEKTTGYSCEEAIGQNPRILKSGQHDEGFYQEMWQILTSGKTWNGQFINKKKDGTFFNEDATISPVRDTSGEIVNYVAVKRDITAEIRMEETLRQAQKMEAVGIMAGGIAHDFNNNLAIILGNVELSLLSVPVGSKTTTRLEDAKTAALRARDLVQQILTYSRQGNQELKPVQVDLVIDETLRLLRSTIPTTVKIKKAITEHSQNIIIQADSTQLQEILINFCNNAVHAMDDKGEIEISLDAVDVKLSDIPAHYERPSGQYAKLRVQDTGSGMSIDTLKRIFDPFYTTKEVGKGTGMGLAVVHGIIETHGGFVVVESILGEGSTFDVYFPMFETIKVEEVTINTDLPKGTERILFLDDEEMLAQLGSTILSEQGYHVTTETSSTKALKIFKENPEQFDLVITDQTMPELCGKDFIKELLTIKPDLPTILCTGYSNKINKAEAKQLGIKAFCLKPLDLQQLVQTTRRVLDEGQL